MGSFAADVGTGDWEDFGGVDGSHGLATAGCDTSFQQESIEVDALVSQRIAFVDTDHRGRQPPHVFNGGEAGPRERVTGLEGFDAVAHLALVVVQVHEDAVVLHRRWAVWVWPVTQDVRAEAIQALNQIDVVLAQQPHAGREGQVSAAAFAGDDDVGRVDAETLGVGR